MLFSDTLQLPKRLPNVDDVLDSSNFIVSDSKQTVYYDFDQFEMIADEKSTLPDFDLLNDLMETREASCSNTNIPAAINEEMEAQNVADVPESSDTGSDQFSYDEKTVAAVLASLETNSVTPIIKEGLRSCIQTKRLQEGKEELEIKFTPYKKREPETAEELARAAKRKEQNKLAARRFRQRQKDVGDKYIKKIHRLETSNTSLQAEIVNLRRAKAELQQLLTSHLSVCTNNPVVIWP
ncbi:hypothetical protein SNE40_008977 [Patella caerulea]|uniref:BZIP domain-containing protein n=1 Tax=Patella caerulea TaxID=87958 RepID=A0AAN8PRD5_PATCE